MVNAVLIFIDIIERSHSSPLILFSLKIM